MDAEHESILEYEAFIPEIFDFSNGSMPHHI
mgnify:FL=1